MEEDKLLHKAEKSSPNDEPLRGEEPDKDKLPAPAEAEVDVPSQSAGGWGWGFSAFSVLSDLQKAAEDISRNAAAVAEKAAKSIADLQEADEDSDSATKKEEETEEHDTEQESEDEKEKIRKSALDKLEGASEDTLLSQGLKVLDNSVETFTSGAWQALGNAWKGGTSLVQKLENSIQQGGSPRTAGSVTPSILETGKALTAKGMQVLEYVGKETIDLLITETGIDIEKNREGTEASGDQLQEEVTFDRCFYIYGGPEQLEELEALSSHYALLFNRRKVKLSPDQKSLYDGKLKQIQQIFSFSDGMGGSNAESDKGKKIESEAETSDDEMKNLHDSSISKAADMAAGFTNALAGLNNRNDMIQRTGGRLDSLQSEGVHRLSEMCCFAVTHLLILGKSIISHANKVEDEDSEAIKIEWPEDPAEKAKMVRGKAESMTGYLEAVANSFITGISDVTEAYLHAARGIAAESEDEHSKPSTVVEKRGTFTERLRSDKSTAVGKIQEGLQHLSYVVISTSMPSA